MTGSGVPEEVQDDLITGVADLEWNTQVPTQDVDQLTSPTWNAQYGVFPAPGNMRPIMRFNILSPNNNGALGKVKVRQALEYAINKVAIGKIFGGSSLTQPLNQVIGPGADGYVPFNDYPTKDNEGDPGKCRRLLAAAGYPDGLTLKDIYIAFLTIGPQVEQEVKTDFGECGVTVVDDPIATGPSDYYGPSGLGASTDVLKKADTWDFTPTTGWGPDWYGPTNGRAILPDLFTLPDAGGYDDPAVDALIKEAESALTFVGGLRLLAQGGRAGHGGRRVHPRGYRARSPLPLSARPQRDLLQFQPELRRHPGLVSAMNRADNPLVRAIGRVPTTVQRKLLVALAIVAVLLVTVGLLGLGALNASNDRVATLGQLPQRSAMYGELEFDSRSLVDELSSRDTLVTCGEGVTCSQTDQELLRDTDARIATALNAISGLLGELHSVPARDRTILSRIQSEFDDIYGQMQKVYPTDITQQYLSLASQEVQADDLQTQAAQLVTNGSNDATTLTNLNQASYLDSQHLFIGVAAGSRGPGPSCRSRSFLVTHRADPEDRHSAGGHRGRRFLRPCRRAQTATSLALSRPISIA